MGEDILQLCEIRELIPEDKKIIYILNIKNKQTATKTQVRKMSREPEQTFFFFQKDTCNSQQAPEKTLNIFNHQGNASQNHDKLSPYTCQNGCYSKDNN